MSEKKDYSSKWVKLKVLPLGGLWAYGVGVIKDAMGDYKVRIVKGKMKKPMKKSSEAKEVDAKSYEHLLNNPHFLFLRLKKEG